MRDNHPRRRQARSAERKLGRAKASRQGLPFILIVCEGEETEPNYLRGLCEARRINLAGVDIKPGGGDTDARSLVKKALNLFKTKDYDRVFVVFDDDGQPFEEATHLASKGLKTTAGQSINVELIATRPAFEFWLLLHFEYSTRPFTTAVDVVNTLRAHLTDYDKADKLIFSQCSAGLHQAITSAERLRRDAAVNGPVSPSTDMDRLIVQLLSMARN
jgi:RloB-like protein